MSEVAVHGARGYLGQQLMRLLDQHPSVDRLIPVSRSTTGSYGAAVPSLRPLQHGFGPGDTADVWFLAVPDAEAEALAQQADEVGATVIDLSRAHRLDAAWHYGVPGIRDVPLGARHIANPGCYPTAFAYCYQAMGALSAASPLVVDGKSGVSGAGVSPRPDLHFPEMNEATRAYKVLDHDHEAEMAAFAAGPVKFTPHLVPQTRGLLVTVYALGPTGAPGTASLPSVWVDEPDTGAVRGTARIEVSVTDAPQQDVRIGRCAIDNLLAGGAATAIRNWNQAAGRSSEVGICPT